MDIQGLNGIIFPGAPDLSLIVIAVIVFAIAFFGAFIGGITGLGGGMLIKPMLGSMLGMAVNAISLYVSKFISTTVVFSMSIKSTTIYRKTGFEYSMKIFKFLAIGLVTGILSVNLIKTPDGALEVLLQGILYFLVFLSVLLRDKYPRLHFHDKPFAIVCVGFVIGFLSAFFGIGGGAIKVPFFLIFFAMTMKEAAIYSFLAALVTEPVKLIQYAFHINAAQSEFVTEAVNSNLIDATTQASINPHLALYIAFVFGLLCVPAAILGAKYGVKIQQRSSDSFVANTFNIVIVYFALISLVSGILMMSGKIEAPLSIFQLFGL